LNDRIINFKKLSDAIRKIRHEVKIREEK